MEVIGILEVSHMQCRGTPAALSPRTICCIA